MQIQKYTSNVLYLRMSSYGQESCRTYEEQMDKLELLVSVTGPKTKPDLLLLKFKQTDKLLETLEENRKEGKFNIYDLPLPVMIWNSLINIKNKLGYKGINPESDFIKEQLDPLIEKSIKIYDDFYLPGYLEKDNKK